MTVGRPSFMTAQAAAAPGSESWVLSDIPTSVLEQRYDILDLLGVGSFGQVYRGLDRKSGEDVAVKFEDMFSGFLSHEIEVLRKLEEVGRPQGFAQLLDSGLEGALSYMVMDRLDVDLLERFKACGGSFSAKCMTLVAQQVISCLEGLHSVGIVHRDVKPENFLTGLGPQAHHIYLTDFGLTIPYTRGRSHLPQETSPGFRGSFRYASVDAHKLLTQSRKDDLEAAGYMLVFLAKGSLPWMNVKSTDWMERNRRTLAMKEATDSSNLAGGLPDCFAEFYSCSRALGFKERPGYAALRQLFQQEQARLADVEGHAVREHELDWIDSAATGMVPLKRVAIAQPEDQIVSRRLLRKVTSAMSMMANSVSNSTISSDDESGDGSKLARAFTAPSGMLRRSLTSCTSSTASPAASPSTSPSEAASTAADIEAEGMTAAIATGSSSGSLSGSSSRRSSDWATNVVASVLPNRSCSSGSISSESARTETPYLVSKATDGERKEDSRNRSGLGRFLCGRSMRVSAPVVGGA